MFKLEDNMLIRRMLKCILWIVCIGAAILFILFVAFIGFITYKTEYEPYQGKKFDKEIWFRVKKGESKPGYYLNTERCKMSGDILDNYLSKDMTIEDVENLLGKIPIGYFYCLDREVKCGMYGLGICVIGGNNHIVVCFDKNNKLVDFSRNRNLPCDQFHRASCFFNKKKCDCTVDDGISIKGFECEVERW